MAKSRTAPITLQSSRSGISSSGGRANSRQAISGGSISHSSVAPGGEASKDTVNSVEELQVGGSTFNLSHGARKMKGYLITEGELSQVSWIGFFATLCFSSSTGLIGFGISITLTMEFAETVSALTLARWSGYQTMSFIVGALFLTGGGALVFFGKTIRDQIRRETIFDKNG